MSIVLGYDEFPGAQSALQTAIELAVRFGEPLVLVPSRPVAVLSQLPARPTKTGLPAGRSRVIVTPRVQGPGPAQEAPT